MEESQEKLKNMNKILKIIRLPFAFIRFSKGDNHSLFTPRRTYLMTLKFSLTIVFYDEFESEESEDSTWKSSC